MKAVKRFSRQVKEREEIFQKLKKADSARILQRPAEGGWHALEILYHLQMSEKGILQLLQKQGQKPAESFSKVGIRNRLACWLLYANLMSPLKFKAPSIVSAVENHPSLMELEEAWKDYKSGMSEIINELIKDKEQSLIFRHHRAGWMDLKGVLGFLYFHQASHLKQIRERAGI